MMRTVGILLICLFCLFGFKTGQFGSVEIHYDFESIEMDSGPDTFELFEQRSAEVSLSSAYAFRGAYSLHVQDQNNNQAFPEFQGYFPPVRGGTLEIGFALMTPSPEEPFNIAFAGEQHFTMMQDGLGFWLLNDSGTLRHMSNSIPKRLIELGAYQWYWFEIKLDVSSGQYSLVINDESGRNLVSLDKQAQPTNAKNSNLLKYSFAGDLEDRGNANLYIDEFVLRTDYADSPQSLIAPGRRSLFVDQWNEYHKKIQNLDFCLAPKLPYDFIDLYNTEGLQGLQRNIEPLRVLLSSPDEDTLAKFTHESELIRGVHQWATGCFYLKNSRYKEAIEQLESAQRRLGYSPATQLGLAIAYAKTNQYYAAQSVASDAQRAWPNDVRWLVVSAAIGFMADRVGDSEMALDSVANALEFRASDARALMQDMGWLIAPAASKLRGAEVWNQEAEEFIVAEQYYFSLLWQDRYREAEAFADDFIGLLKRHRLVSPLWHERAGDAAIFSQRFSAAEREYQRAIKAQGYRMSSLQKLADVYFLQGRVDDEREVRESIFGALNYE